MRQVRNDRFLGMHDKRNIRTKLNTAKKIGRKPPYEFPADYDDEVNNTPLDARQMWARRCI